MESLATEFGPYHCEGNITLSFYKASLGLGQFIGMFLAVTISDNLSRRKAYLFCCFVSLFGMLMVFTASSMGIAVFGLFVVGLSNSPNLRIIQVIVSETTEKELKQTFLSTQLGAFGIGSLLVGILYPSIGHWRTSILLCGILPGLVIMVGFFFIIEDTPKFLMRSTPEEAARALNKIGKINTGNENMYNP